MEPHEPRTNRPPSYRHHKARNLAVVTIDGRDHYLGPYASPESYEKYERKIAEWRQQCVNIPGTLSSCNGTHASSPTSPVMTTVVVTINEVILTYVGHAKTYYRSKSGKPTGELDNIKYAVRTVKKLYGRTTQRCRELIEENRPTTGSVRTVVCHFVL
ncbi:MAG: hypothetical protein R3C10_06550 [Pirellulales bacterium]